MNNNDKRVQRTKRKIKKALFQLLDQKGIDRITVKSILETAGLNRTTFYAYYNDKYDLLEKLQANVIKQIIRIKQENPVGGGRTLEETRQLVKNYFLALFKYVHAQHNEVKLLLINSEKVTMLRNITRVNPEFYNHWRPVVIQIRGIEPQYSYAALVGVTINFYFEFEASDFTTSPDKIATVLSDIVIRYLQ